MELWKSVPAAGEQSERGELFLCSQVRVDSLLCSQIPAKTRPELSEKVLYKIKQGKKEMGNCK